jgi:DNA-directed RNA polymerase specialized sigma24 family protein
MTNILFSVIDELYSVSKHALRMRAIEESSHLEAAHALGVSVGESNPDYFMEGEY